MHLPTPSQITARLAGGADPSFGGALDRATRLPLRRQLAELRQAVAQGMDRRHGMAPNGAPEHLNPLTEFQSGLIEAIDRFDSALEHDPPSVGPAIQAAGLFGTVLSRRDPLILSRDNDAQVWALLGAAHRSTLIWLEAVIPPR